jgi:hypothetical protein
MTITRRPPHRRALLTHRAPTSGHEVEPPVGTGHARDRAGVISVRDRLGGHVVAIDPTRSDAAGHGTPARPIRSRCIKPAKAFRGRGVPLLCRAARGTRDRRLTRSQAKGSTASTWTSDPLCDAPRPEVERVLGMLLKLQDLRGTMMPGAAARLEWGSARMCWA